MRVLVGGQISGRQASGGIVRQQLTQQGRDARGWQWRQISRHWRQRPAQSIGVGGFVERFDRAQHGTGARIAKVDLRRFPREKIPRVL